VAGCVLLLGRREQAVGQPGATRQRALEALDLDQVYSNRETAHSTVTVFARLRG
jgi:hypothetical protein